MERKLKKHPPLSAFPFFFGLFFLTLPCLLPPPSSANPLREILPNGLNVFIFEKPGTTSVSVDLWVNVGARYESSKNNGISHFVEHLLFKGTSQRTAKDISREIAAVGGRLDGLTHWEYTQLHISLLPLNLDVALEILADISRNSLFSEEMVEKERKVIFEEISLGNLYPPSYVLNLVSRTLFADDPLGMPISGTKETVKTLHRQDLLDFYRRYYVPNNALITVVGNVDSLSAQAMIRSKFEDWPKGNQLPSPPSLPLRQNKLKEVRQRKFIDQAIVVVALQTMGVKDLDRPVFEIINAILGSGGNSRLYQEIREKRALSYLVGSLFHPLSDTGLWATYAGTAPKNIDRVQSVIFAQIKKMQEEPLSLRELDEIKSYIRGRTLIRTENNSSLAGFIGPRLLAGTWELPEEFIAKVQGVTVEDVKRVAQTYLREDHCNIIILKPYPGLSLFRGLL